MSNRFELSFDLARRAPRTRVDRLIHACGNANRIATAWLGGETGLGEHPTVKLEIQVLMSAFARNHGIEAIDERVPELKSHSKLAIAIALDQL